MSAYRTLFCLSLGLLAPACAHGPAAPSQQSQVENYPETQKLLESLVSQETHQYRGPSRALQLVALLLEQKGLKVERYAKPQSSRLLALFARWPAKAPGKAPIVLLSHVDAPPFEGHVWPKQQGPLSAAIVEGELWGRGTLGAKALVSLHAGVLLELLQKEKHLPREVILGITTDGLGESADGLQLLLEKHPEIGAAQLALTGGGAIYPDLLGQEGLTHAIATGEHGYARILLSAEASEQKSANDRLQAALQTIKEQPRQARLSPPVHQILAQLGEQGSWPGSWFYRSEVLQATLLPSLEAHPVTSVLVKDSLEHSVLPQAYIRSNYRAQRAHALLKAQLRPQSSPEILLDRLRQQIKDSLVHINIEEGDRASWKALPLRHDGPFATILRGQEGERITRFFAEGPSQARTLRRIGVSVYGYLPLVLDEPAWRSRSGRNERVRLSELMKAQAVMLRLVEALAEE